MTDDPTNNDRAVRAAADLKETEDLLAGFDRPGRTPRTPPTKPDFVDYHLGHKNGRSDAELLSKAELEQEKRAQSTVLLPRERWKLPEWFPWAALLVLMPMGGGLVAYSVLGNGSPSRASSTPSESIPSAATTISAARTPTTHSSVDVGRDAWVPTASASTSEGKGEPRVARPSASQHPTAPSTSASTAGRTPSPATKNEPRIDFIRDL